MLRKDHLVATMISASTGGIFGFDRFYLGYVLWGLLKMFSVGGIGIWWIIDLIWISHCWIVDANGRTMQGCQDPFQEGKQVRLPKVAENFDPKNNTSTDAKGDTQ